MKTEVKVENRHQLMVYADRPLEWIPVDTAIFDVFLSHLYGVMQTVAKPDSEHEIAVKVPVSLPDKFSSIDEFKSIAALKGKGILDVLVKYNLINSYELQYVTRIVVLKEWGDSLKYEEIDKPSYLANTKLIPATYSKYIEDRFAIRKAYYEEIAEVYSRIVKIIEEFFTEPVSLNPTLSKFYDSLVFRLNELFKKNYRITLFHELVLPFTDLMLEKWQIAEIMKDLSKYTNPLHDNYMRLQKLISLYTLDAPKDPDFQQIDEYLENVQVEKQKPTSFQNVKKFKLSEAKISFEDNTAILHIGNKDCQLPPYKNEHFFCRIMFQYQANEPVDWSAVYEKLTYHPVNDKNKNKRTVYDTTEAINNRIKEVIGTDDELFSWEGKAIKRNF